MTRSLIRENIFKLLFRIEFNSVEEMLKQIQFFFEDELLGDETEEENAGASISEKDMTYIKEKLEKIFDKLPVIDEKIATASKGWSLSRIGKVELAILRLAVYEMLFDDDIPVGVAIDEAVELTKKYGQDGSPAFINGVLAAVAK